ncbi:MAG: hypothetical protein JWR69_451 [Pedosphaera sp.]|nr:hypothetical protein [Pedosphaera sp.]
MFTLAFIGCRREEIQVYRAPKDALPPQTQTAEVAHDAARETKTRPRPQVSWKLPPGWKEGSPNQISLASFNIAGPQNQQAQVNITELANFSGRDGQIVNMWRNQVGLEPLSNEDALKQLQAVEVSAEKGNLFEVSGTNKDGPFSILTAFVHHPDGSWFYKLAGDVALVQAQKPVFIEFLKSIQIKETASTEPDEPAAQGKLGWTVPAGWKAVAPGDMQVARFSTPQKGNASAEVFVSIFPSDTGGTFANVTRWRKQIGLAPVEEKDLASLVAPLDPSTPGAILVDLDNKGKRLIGAIVPRDGKYWFYKLLGDAEAVGPEKESFIAFAKSKP